MNHRTPNISREREAAIHPDAFLIDLDDLGPMASEQPSSNRRPTSIHPWSLDQLLGALEVGGASQFVAAIRSA